MKRMFTTFLVLLMVAVFSYGCESMGRALAKTEKGIQKGADKLEESIGNATDDFNKGYDGEKPKKQ